MTNFIKSNNIKVSLEFIAILVLSFSYIIIALTLVLSNKIEVSDEIKGMIIGFAGSQVTAVIGYYFGSSRGSKQKDEVITELSRSKQQQDEEN